MTEIWISSKKNRTPMCVGSVGQDRAKHVAAEWNRKGYRVKLRNVQEM